METNETEENQECYLDWEEEEALTKIWVGRGQGGLPGAWKTSSHIKILCRSLKRFRPLDTRHRPLWNEVKYHTERGVHSKTYS